jgi:CIC family chloride channel protein
MPRKKKKHASHLLKRAHLRFLRWIERLNPPTYLFLVTFAVITGLAAGFGSVLFHRLIELMEELFFQRGPVLMHASGRYYVVIVPAVGMLVLAWMTHMWPERAKQRGVIEVIRAVATRGGYIPFRTTLFHFFAPALCIGSGGTLGPEGPAAQIGSGISSMVGRFLGLPESRRRIFTAAGAGAAISAVFNTPIGGIFFALEVVLLNDFQAATFSVLILASVSASMVSRIYLGSEPRFLFSEFSIGPYRWIFLYAVLGIVAGLLSILFIRYAETLHRWVAKKGRHISLYARAAGVGLALGIVGFFLPQLFGVGYGAVNEVLQGDFPVFVALALLVAKLVFVPLILENGGFGGVFAPAIFMGAFLGYLFYQLLGEGLGMQFHATPFILVGMGAVLAGINMIPLTAILMLFEMTNDYSFILPLMLGVVASTTVVQMVLRESFLVSELRQEGLRIASGRERNLLQSIQVREVMRPEILTVPESAPISDVLKLAIDSDHTVLFTTGRGGKLTGYIKIDDLRPLLLDSEHLRPMLVAKDIAIPGVATLRETDDLDTAMKLFGRYGIDEVPVKSATDRGHIVGTLWQQDVIKAYNKETLRANLADGLSKHLATLDKTTQLDILPGYVLTEIPAPRSFIGKTLRQLQVRNRYGAEVLLIKRPADELSEDGRTTTLLPSADYRIRSGDSLVLFGPHEQLKELMEE